MQFPAKHAHPFEFARPVLLLVALSFFVGFFGYVALNPAKAEVARAAAPAPAVAPVPATVSEPRAQDWHFPKKI